MTKAKIDFQETQVTIKEPYVKFELTLEDAYLLYNLLGHIQYTEITSSLYGALDGLFHTEGCVHTTDVYKDMPVVCDNFLDSKLFKKNLDSIRKRVKDTEL